MLNTLKALFRANPAGGSKEEKSADARSIAPGLPASLAHVEMQGLRLDGRVKIQLVGLRAYEDALFCWDDETYHHIAAVGHVDLGQGAHLVRFYLDNDTWLQANIEHGRVVEYKLFDFYRVDHVSDAEFDAVVNGAEKRADALGAQQVDISSTQVAGKVCTFKRVWGDTGSLWSPPVLFEEEVMTTETIASRQVRHHAMLYERPIAGSDRLEYLLLSAEDDGEGSFMVVHNIGVDVASVDIDAL
ncbi:DUF2491 family protein [Halomonas sp. Bachu 37]|uniref:DUF2491 family protein n=1 Tax=Halomonas kashgarensis TaxID=3084920 RepID=UPI003216B703